MSVDKFGRYSESSGGSCGGRTHQQVVRGVGYELTPEGDYDIKGKLLRNVASPLAKTDAVNLETVETKCLTFDNVKQKYHTKGLPLGGLGKAEDTDDAVTRGYLESLIPIKLTLTDYSVKQSRIQDVGEPIAAGDAINMAYAKKNFLVMNKDYVGGGAFDACNTRICNLKMPIFKEDAVSKLYVDNKSIPFDSRAWYFLNRRIAQVGPPMYGPDAINLTYFMENTVKLIQVPDGGDEIFSADSKRISNLPDATADIDAVNLRQLKQYTRDLEEWVKTNVLLKNQRNNCYNAEAKRICNVARGGADTDAIILEQLVDAINVLKADFRSYCKSELIDFAHAIKKEYSRVDIPKESIMNWRALWSLDYEIGAE